MKTEREFKIILPKHDRGGHRLSTEVIKDYADKMTEHFGGVTVIPSVLGCYESEKTGRVECEENTIMMSARDSSDESVIEKDVKFMNDLAKNAGEIFGQESIFIEEDIVKDVSFVAGVKKEAVPKVIREQEWFKKLLD